MGEDEGCILHKLTILLHGSKHLVDVLNAATLIVAAIVQLRVHPAVNVEARLRTDERAKILHALISEVVADDAVGIRLTVGICTLLHEDDGLSFPLLPSLLTDTTYFVTHFY